MTPEPTPTMTQSRFHCDYCTGHLRHVPGCPEIEREHKASEDSWREACERLNARIADQERELAAANGAKLHMDACRALLSVPNDEVLHEAIERLQSQASRLAGALRFLLDEAECASPHAIAGAQRELAAWEGGGR